MNLFLKIIIIYSLFLSPLFSQFGKNKVQYEQFDWSFIQTEHFDIYYYNEGKEQAEFVAYYSEEAYKKISNLIGWGLSKRSDIFVYNSHNDFQQTNIVSSHMGEGVGGVTELFKNRMVIPYNGSLKEFKHVIYHELVHVFINDGIYGGSIMNAIKANAVMIPLWMNEGLAEYLADDWDTNSDMWLRDITINSNQIPEISYLNGYLAYRGGQSVWNFITDKWGEEIIAELFNNIKFKNDTNKAIETTLGINLEELSLQWHKYLKKQYWPDIDYRQDIKDISRQVTSHETLNNNYNIGPSVSPDGSKIAIYSNKDGGMSIYIISLDDGSFLFKVVSAQVTSEIEELHILKPGITWSPDGKQLAFAAKSGASDALIIVDPSNPKNKIKKKFNIEGIYRPVWNPMNNKIAFVGYNNFSSDIFIYDIDDDILTQVTNDIFSDIQISWSPDGQSLLMVSDRENYISKNNIDIVSAIRLSFNNYDIYKIDKEYNITQLTNTVYNEIYPQYSPDGQMIAYISDESGINNIYVTEDEFLTSTNITNVLTGITQIDWFTNTELVFTGFYKSGYDIFVLSDINTKVENTEPIINSKWRNKHKDYNLLRKSDIYSSNNFSDYLENYKFTQNSREVNSIGESVWDLDSLGMHIPYKYNRRFTLDYYGAQYEYDILQNEGQGMGYFLFSDILGNHKIELQTSLVIDFKHTDILLNYLNLENRINWGLLFYNNSVVGPYDVTTGSYNFFKDIGLNINFQNPFSKFSRIEGGVAHNYLEENEETTDWIGNTNTDYVASINLTRYYVKYVWDNTQFFGGNRTFVEYMSAPSTNSNDKVFDKIELDSRNYINLSSSGYVTFASRLFFGTSWGRDARIFGIGGSGYNTLFHGDDSLLNSDYGTANDYYQYVSMNNFQFPIRGYNIAQKFGNKALIANFELRLPFLIYYFPTIKYFGQIFGVLFIDAGVAWNDDFPDFSDQDNWNISDNEGWIMSCGFGPRFYFLGMPWKLDYAWQYNPHRGIISSRKWYLSIGFDF